MNLYKVDSFWLVQARNVQKAKEALGRYHDLPWEWYRALQVEFMGISGRIPPGMFQQEIIQE